MTRPFKITLAGLSIVLSSCSFKPFESIDSSSSKEESASNPESSVSIEESEMLKTDFSNGEAPSIFSIDNKVEVSLHFKDGVLSDLCRLGTNGGNSRYYDLYFPCDITLTVNGEPTLFEDAGIRMKGNTSRRNICESDEIITGSCHFKVNLKCTFDGSEYDLDAETQKYKVDWTDKEEARKERKNRSMDGVTKFDLKYLPRNYDGTIGQEVYAYEAFRKNGIMSPFASIAPVTLENSKSSLTYDAEIIETIDKDFLKNRLGKAEAKGDLYKCVYGPRGKADFTRTNSVNVDYDENGYACGSTLKGEKIGFENNVDNYHPCYDLKTNDDNPEAQDFSTMSTFINALWSACYAKAPKTLVESVLDVEQFLRFSAISWLLGNPDDQRYNYNNFYMYFLPSNGKAYFIPYDWDWCLGQDWGNHNMDSRGLFDEKDADGNTLENNLFRATFLPKKNSLSYDVSNYQKVYKEYAEQGVKDGLLDFENYKALCDGLNTENHSEYSKVSAYMNAKKRVIGA